MNTLRMMMRALPLVTVFALALTALPASAETRAEIDQGADAALKILLDREEAALKLHSEASAVLIFPDVIKAGLLVGGQYGNGVLRKDGKSVGYYNTSAASYGLQAGAQAFGYVMMFMTDDALKYLDSSSGWEVGIGPSVVVVDDGVARALTTTTEREDIYVFFVNQKGLMAGLGIQGSKITPITPDE